MRVLSCALLAAIAAGSEPVRSQESAAAQVVAEMRRALGGGAALDAVQTVRGAGVATRGLGDLRVSGEVEILLALPDRYLRRDRVRLAGLTSEVVAGVDGDAFLQRATGPDGLRVDPAATLDPGVRDVVAAGALRGARHDVIRLMLALLGEARGASLTFAVAGRAEGPEWTADLLQVRGPDGFDARLFIDTDTRLPVMIAWDAPDTSGAIRRFAAGYKDRLARGEKLSAADLLNQAQSFVEHRLYLSEFRRAGRLIWPHRFRRTAGAEPIEDLTFERFWVNPALDARAFNPDR